MRLRQPIKKYRTRRRGYWIVFGMASLILIWRWLFWLDFTPAQKQQFGVSFSQSQAEYLDQDWQVVYSAILDDLSVKYIRLGAYWNRIERQPGQYDFSELDWLMDQAAQRNVKIILAVGRRLPRWPECHIPDWAIDKPNNEQQQIVADLVTKVVKRYASHPALEFWQIENEPFLKIFGRCPETSRSFVEAEIALVKSIDNLHPTLTTDSGELATWLKTAHLGDYFGTSTYRVVYQPWFKYIKHNQTIPAALYQAKAWLVGLDPTKIILTELQAEPWPPGDLITTPISEQFRSMDIKQFKSNIEFSKKMGFPRVYLWGAEWWYWMSKQGYSQYWDGAKTLF